MSRQKLTVSFLGPFASFSHQATKNAFPEDEYHLVPAGKIEDIFEIVQSGRADYGIVPFENSTHGLVTTTLDGLADRQNKFSSLSVCGEIFLGVHHYLLGRRAPGDDSPSGPAAGSADVARQPQKPLASLTHIERIYSHPQALGQTTEFCSAHLPGVEKIAVSSTSKAAELVAHDATGTSAAVSSVLAAEMHQLDVLAEWIEDRQDNTTRFFVIRRTHDEVAAEALGSERASRYQSLVSFTLPQRSPAALADVLECFRKWRLNVTSINSLPSWIKPFQHLFLVEFEGSKLRDPEGKVQRALDDVGQVAQSWRWLGSWENQW